MFSGSREETEGEQSTMAGPHAHDNGSHHLRHRCHFPISRATTSNAELPSQYSRIPICSNDKRRVKEQRAHVADISSEELLFAWAVLLHKYIGSEAVSFAVINDSDNVGGLVPRKHISNGIEGKGTSDVAIVQYQISDTTTCKDVSHISREPWSAGALSRDGAVNTAVYLSGEMDVTNGGQEEVEDDLSVSLGKYPKDVSQYVRGSRSHSLFTSRSCGPIKTRKTTFQVD